MKKQNTKHQLSRSEFLRLIARLGGAAFAAPFIQACQQTGVIDAAEITASTQTSTNTVTPTQTQTPTHQPTSTTPPTETLTPSPTATPSPTDTFTPAPTATLLPTPTPAPDSAYVALVKTKDRAEGVRQAIEMLGINSFAGKRVFVKPNLNSADPPPAATAPEVLRSTIIKLQDLGVGQITVGDRAGMGIARNVMETMGGLEMAAELGFDFIDFEELTTWNDWVMVTPPDTLWQTDMYPLKPGFPIARPVLDADAIVSLCCLKTHGWGGVISMSLKNSLGMVANVLPGQEGASYMDDLLHDGDVPAMAAEVNLAYEPALVVLDGVAAFKDGGPAFGTQVNPGVILAGTDRVAIDAIGAAILNMHKAHLGKIASVGQIRKAIQLGLGIDRLEKIHIVTADDASARFAQKVRKKLAKDWGGS